MLEEIVKLEGELEEARYLKEKYGTLELILQKQLEAARDKDAWQNKYPDPSPPPEPDRVVSPASETIGPLEGKPRSQKIEEFMRELWRPMHISDVVDELKARGEVFNGKSSPKEQVRSALKKSKRFINVGGNTWWLDGVPMPEGQRMVDTAQVDTGNVATIEELPRQKAIPPISADGALALG